MTPPPFIVAEINKNWRDGVPATPGTITEAFDRVINVNHLRGYRLHSFVLHQVYVSVEAPNDTFSETIIAVFELTDQGWRVIAPQGAGVPS